MASLEFDLVGNVKLNTQQAQQQMNGLVNHTSVPSMIQSSNLPPMLGTNNNIEGLAEKSDYLGDNFNTLHDEVKKVVESFKSLVATLGDTEKKYSDELSKPKTKKIAVQDETTQNIKGINSIKGVVSTSDNILRSVSNENYGGAVAGTFNSASFNLNNYAQYRQSKGDAVDGLMTAAAGIGIAGAMVNTWNTLADNYLNVLPSSENLLRNYGNISGDSGVNTAQMNMLRSQMFAGARNTGLSTEDYISLVNEQSKYGISDVNKAMAIATDVGKWAHYTGADSSQINGYAGLITRMGGNSSSALNQAFKAATAQGLEKGQFGEFLSGLQSVIENGISKGYIKSTKEVSEQLDFLSLLSGNNPMWEGKYGAERYQQMASGMASNVSMQSTESMLVYQAAKSALGPDASRLDVLKFIESGDVGNESFLKSLKDIMGNVYNGNNEAGIYAIKNMFGLNSIQTAEDVYNMIMKVGTPGNSAKDVKNKISSANGKTDFTDIYTDRQNAKNDINEVLVQFGAGLGTVNVKVEELIANLSKLLPGLEEQQRKVEEKKQQAQRKEEEKAFKDNKKDYGGISAIGYRNNFSKLISYESYGSNKELSGEQDYSNQVYSRPIEVNRKRLFEEAQLKTATTQEKDLWSLLDQAERAGVDVKTYQGWMQSAAEAVDVDKARKNNKDYKFDSDKMAILLSDIKEQLKNMHIITQ